MRSLINVYRRIKAMSNIADDVIQIKNSLGLITKFNADLSAKLDALVAPPASQIDLMPVLAAIAAIPASQPADLSPVLSALADLKATVKSDVEPTPAAE